MTGWVDVVTDMTVYFKATRPDGTDFYSGTVQYAVGKRVRPRDTASKAPWFWPKGSRILCGPGYLHAADVPAETLIGGEWPCRLFEVTGKPDVGFDTDHPHKGGFKQLSVVREIDSHLALGPNGREVAALIDRARRLTPEENEALAAAWDAARHAARYAAWDAAWNAARVAAWNAAKVAAWAAARNVAWHAARSATEKAAWVAARNAASALVVRDLITLEQFDVLYGPWRDVIG
jgi:hypothetical protein